MRSLSIKEPEVIVTVLEETVQVNVNDNSICVSVSESGPQGPRGTQVLSGTVDPSIVIGLIGDQYINTSTGYIFGPKTESGWGTGFRLGLTLNDIAHAHYQTTASGVWNIVHTLEFTPDIVVVDLDGNVIEGDYEYNGNTIVANFSNAITGAAYLS